MSVSNKEKVLKEVLEFVKNVIKKNIFMQKDYVLKENMSKGNKY